MESKGHRKCCIAEWDGNGSKVLGGGEELVSCLVGQWKGKYVVKQHIAVPWSEL